MGVSSKHFASLSLTQEGKLRALGNIDLARANTSNKE